MKNIIILLFLLTMVMETSFGQTNEHSPIYLSNYTFSDGQQTIGEIQVRGVNASEIKSISLQGEQAKAFKVSKDYQLSVVKGKLQPTLKWVDLTVRAKTAGGEMEQKFRIVRDEFIRNKVIAHRGAWKNTATSENSIAALKHAIDMGCEGSEFDVHMSADSMLYINHDPAIQGVSIAKSSSSQLSTIKLSNGESLPTLESYLKEGMQQNKTKLILEIKASELGKESSLALTQKVTSLVEKLQAQAWVDYISFDYDVCKKVMQLAPYAKVAYLMGDKTPEELAQNNFYGLDYHFSTLQKNPEWIKDAKQRKLTVNVWTVNDEAIMQNLLKENVEFITTNEPELLLKLISAK